MNDAIAAPAPTQDERTMALLAHILQVFTGWIGPLIIYVLKRDSKFVSFHALQALLWQIAVLVLAMVGVFAWLFAAFGVIVPLIGRPASHQAPPVGFFLAIGTFWLAIMAVGVANLVLGIVFAIKASNGEWASYPIIGRWARHIVQV